MRTNRQRTNARLLALAAFAGATVVASSPALAQALQPVVRTSGIIQDTVVAICLALMTAGIGIAGYRIMFAGANFRDVSNLVIGGSIAGAAAALAAVFIV